MDDLKSAVYQFLQSCGLTQTAQSFLRESHHVVSDPPYQLTDLITRIQQLEERVSRKVIRIRPRQARLLRPTAKPIDAVGGDARCIYYTTNGKLYSASNKQLCEQCDRFAVFEDHVLVQNKLNLKLISRESLQTVHEKELAVEPIGLRKLGDSAAVVQDRSGAVQRLQMDLQTERLFQAEVGRLTVGAVIALQHGAKVDVYSNEGDRIAELAEDGRILGVFLSQFLFVQLQKALRIYSTTGCFLGEVQIAAGVVGVFASDTELTVYFDNGLIQTMKMNGEVMRKVQVKAMLTCTAQAGDDFVAGAVDGIYRVEVE